MPDRHFRHDHCKASACKRNSRFDNAHKPYLRSNCGRPISACTNPNWAISALIWGGREIPYKINWLGYCKRFANQDNCLYGHLTGTHRREEMTTETKEIQGAVKIGNGTKLHKAYKDASNHLWICCGCPGTQQGSAYNRAKFFANTTPTCKN
jgi:hypothetical protein